MVMAIAVSSSSLPLGEEGLCCSTSCGAPTRLTKPHLGAHALLGHAAGLRNPLFGTSRSLCVGGGQDGQWRVSVAADYSDSVPDSSNHRVSNGGYHPLEDLKVSKKNWEASLTPAEIARTTVEANNCALLMFPGAVHCEPHENITWAESQYVIDDYGDIYFEIFDDANILEDPAASNPVIALIGIDMPTYENRRVAGEYSGSIDEITFDEEYFEVLDAEDPFDWGMPNTSTLIHPIYFAKCLTKAVATEYDRKMDYPSNGVSILGCLRPAFVDEESYIRKLFHYEDGDGYNSEWSDGETFSCSPDSDRGNNRHSTLYRLEILRIELFSVYGIQNAISLQDFQDAEPDFLVHSTSTIVQHFKEKGISCDVALKALCKKKGLHVEGANLIGVDSLGMDVRVSLGPELQTRRFPFKVRANSEVAAEKQIQQLLFPRARRKKLRNHESDLRNPASF